MDVLLDSIGNGNFVHSLCEHLIYVGLYDMSLQWQGKRKNYFINPHRFQLECHESFR